MDIEGRIQRYREETQRNLAEVARLQRVAEERMALADAHMDRADARMDRADTRMDRAESRMDRLEAFLADAWAKAEARMDRADARMDRADAREAARQVKIDKQNQITRRFIQGGLKIAKDLGKKHRELDFKITALIDAQNRFLESMRRSSGNGRSR